MSAPTITHPTCCPVPADAWAIVSELTELALEGDADAIRILPEAVAHALALEAAS